MLIPPPHRQSISERKAPPGRPVSQLPQPAGCLAKKSLVFAAGGGTHQTTTRTNAEFKRPLPPVSTATLGMIEKYLQQSLFGKHHTQPN